MASNQTPATKVDFNDEEKSVLEEVNRELDNFVSESKELQAVVHGAIGNATKRTLELKYIHIYSGHFGASSPASVIEPRKATKFVHEGTPPKGSKVGLVYAGNGHQWVLGWNVPLISTQMRNTVFVSDGPETPVDWDLFEKVMDGEAPTITVMPNAYAHITQGHKARLTAVFCEPPRVVEA